MQYNYELPTDVGFENDMKVDGKCGYCDSYFRLSFFVSINDALDLENNIGKQLHQNGFISFENCEVCDAWF